MLNLIRLLDDEKCCSVVRELRWPNGVQCSHCANPYFTKQGRDDTQRCRQWYRCLHRQRKFNDLTGTVFAGHHQPLRQWAGCLYLMGLNLSNSQIAQELGLNENDVQDMTRILRQGVVERSDTPQLSGTVEIGEVYIVAGHKGQSALVKKTAELLVNEA